MMEACLLGGGKAFFLKPVPDLANIPPENGSSLLHVTAEEKYSSPDAGNSEDEVGQRHSLLFSIWVYIYICIKIHHRQQRKSRITTQP